MPLPPATNRTLKHTRRVVCEGFKREDGLWDIEAYLLDTKTFTMMNKIEPDKVFLEAGAPLHEMSIRITVDLELNILDAVASMDETPLPGCDNIAASYKQLIGLQIAPGFTRTTKELFSGTQGCTHLLELLGPLATAAFQATHQERENAANFWQDGDVPPPMLNTCHTLDSKGPVVQETWPHFYDGASPLATAPIADTEERARC